MTGTNTVPAATGIVLAGGRSRRFGRDKLAERVGGTPLLDRAVQGLAAVTTEVIVVAAPGMDPPVPAGVRVTHDETPFDGPLAGCLAGLAEAREPIVLIAGGDMPTMQPDVLAAMLRALTSSSADACVLEQAGQHRPLPMAIRTGTATALVTRLLGERERRLGAILDRLIVRSLPEGEWRPLDPEAGTLRDVDVPDDLDGLDLR